MADKTKEKKSKEEKQREKAEKKALKLKAKEAKKRAKEEAKEEKNKAKLDKKNPKDPKVKPDKGKPDEKKPGKPPKKKFFTIKKLIILPIVFILIIGAAFYAYKKFFSSSETPEIVYKSIVLKNIDLPDEMLRFTFSNINELYFLFINYNSSIILLNTEIDRINRIGENYPDQKNIAEKEKSNWIKAKEKVEKKFFKIEKDIRVLYVLYIVNREEGIKKIEEKSKELLVQANEALETLDPYIKTIETTKEREPQGLIDQTIKKIKKIF